MAEVCPPAFFCSVNVLAEKANKVEAVRAVLLSLLKSVRTRRGKERITYLALQFSMLVVFSMFRTPPPKQSYNAVRQKYSIGNKGLLVLSDFILAFLVLLDFISAFLDFILTFLVILGVMW